MLTSTPGLKSRSCQETSTSRPIQWTSSLRSMTLVTPSMRWPNTCLGVKRLNLTPVLSASLTNIAKPFYHWVIQASSQTVPLLRWVLAARSVRFLARWRGAVLTLWRGGRGWTATVWSLMSTLWGEIWHWSGSRGSSSFAQLKRKCLCNCHKLII